MASASAHLSNVSTWIACTGDDLEVGMTAKVIETHINGGEIVATVTIEGVATRIDHNYIWFGPVVSTKIERTEVQTQWYRLPKTLPLAIGSAIKVYDPTLLRDRVAICRVRPGAETIRETGWFFLSNAGSIDTHCQPVPDHLTDSAEVLFDAGKA